MTRTLSQSIDGLERFEALEWRIPQAGPHEGAIDAVGVVRLRVIAHV